MTKPSIADITIQELADARLRGHLFPQKMRTVVDAVREGKNRGRFTFEEVGTSEEELTALLQKAGLS